MSQEIKDRIKGCILSTLLLETTFSDYQMVARINAMVPVTIPLEYIQGVLQEMTKDGEVVNYSSCEVNFYHLPYVITG